MAGYSGTPLAKKPGFKDGGRVRISNAPDNYLDLVSPRPDEVQISKSIPKDIDIWHFFTKSVIELKQELPRQIKAMRQDGMIWVSWPKNASKVATDLTEDVIRDVTLPLGLVDIKVCAVDDTWSGLKLVVRQEFRK